MYLTILGIYLIGSALALGISTVILYSQYSKGEDIALADIVAFVILPFFSWLSLGVMLCATIGRYWLTTIIKGKKQEPKC